MAIAGTALLILAPSYGRNIHTFQHPLGPAQARADLGNAAHGAGPLASNVLRNAALHLRTPVRAVNDGVARSVERLDAWIGQDPEDPRTTYPGETWRVSYVSTYEGRMGNPLHFLVFGTTLVLACLRPTRNVQRHYGVAVLAGALLFCWTFRWQHWHGRLHTPFFLLAAPLAGTLLQRFAVGWRAWVLSGVFWLAALPWLVANQMRPLVSLPDTRLTYAAPGVFSTEREQQYFGKDITRVYERVLDDLAQRGCSDLGLVGGEETRAYPLFPFARSRGLDLRLHYLFVKNQTRDLEERPDICALFVAEEQPEGWRPAPPYDSLELQWREGRFALWTRAPT